MWQDIYNALASLAILVGGGWALYHFVLRREGESGLQIEFNVQDEDAVGIAQLKTVEVNIKNIGKRKLELDQNANITAGEEESEESFRHPFSLKIRNITGALNNFDCYDWSRFNFSHKNSDQEYDLLIGYDKTVFFAEPGEEYSFLKIINLAPGDYLLKATFIGKRDYEYWQRVRYLHIS